MLRSVESRKEMWPIKLVFFSVRKSFSINLFSFYFQETFKFQLDFWSNVCVNAARIARVRQRHMTHSCQKRKNLVCYKNWLSRQSLYARTRKKKSFVLTKSIFALLLARTIIVINQRTLWVHFFKVWNFSFCSYWSGSFWTKIKVDLILIECNKCSMIELVFWCNFMQYSKLSTFQ